jgi:1-acyl-sn-glycerol-3-phosphate acyltransferase
MFRFIRFLSFAWWLLVFFIKALFIKAGTRDPLKQRFLLAQNTSQTSRNMLRGFRIKINLINPQNLQSLKQENHLVAANHVSYTDIVVLSSLHPLVFITSTDMAATPVLGDITRFGGSLFTNREKHTSLPEEINNFARALSQGFDLVLFPEGTSTSGETFLPFRKSLFQTPIIAQKPVLPICLKYKTLDGKPITTQKQRDVVCWYGEMFFAPHFWELIRHKVEVDVTVLPSIPYDETVKRQELSDRVFGQLMEVYQKQ